MPKEHPLQVGKGNRIGFPFQYGIAYPIGTVRDFLRGKEFRRFGDGVGQRDSLHDAEQHHRRRVDVRSLLPDDYRGSIYFGETTIEVGADGLENAFGPGTRALTFNVPNNLVGSERFFSDGKGRVTYCGLGLGY